jgi:hypothetical protein
MTDREVIDTKRMPDGTEYRVLLERDPSPEEPYNDGGWPILRLEYTRYQNRYVATAFNQQATPYVEKFNEFSNRGYDTETFQRYLRIFHDTIRPDKKFGETFKEYGPNNGTDYTYIAFAPRQWREAMGVDIEQCMSEDPLAEVRAWIEGDVWGYALESRYDPDDKGGEWLDANDSCGGFYGRKYAEEEGKTILLGAVENHKVVHRYTESEKLVAVETEVRAILEFLETHTLQGHTAVKGGQQQMVYEHFGIDYTKIQEERELMLKRLQEEETPQ